MLNIFVKLLGENMHFNFFNFLCCKNPFSEQFSLYVAPIRSKKLEKHFFLLKIYITTKQKIILIHVIVARKRPHRKPLCVPWVCCDCFDTCAMAHLQK